MAYAEPGLIVRKEKKNFAVTINETQRFPMFVGLGRNTIEISLEQVVRGLDDSPVDPTLAPKNGMDSLSRPALQLLAVESAPGLRDYIPNLDYVLTSGKVDWGPVISTSVFKENSIGVDGTYQVVVNRPKVSAVSQVKNYSAFVSAESLSIGSNAVFNSGSNTITITLAKKPISNSLGRALATFSDNSFVFSSDSNNRFLPANQIPFSSPFTADKQWKADYSNGIIISYSPTDGTLASGLVLDYFYIETYNVGNVAVAPDGLSFILDPGLNIGKTVFLSTDYLEVDYTSINDGREPLPGETYYVSYLALKTDDELIPEFFGPDDRLLFQQKYGFAEEFLTGNQLALAGEIQYSLGTQGFNVTPIKQDIVLDWAEALEKTSELLYDDLIILSSDVQVKQLARKLTLDRSAPEKKRRTIGWFATSFNQPNGFSSSDPGSILAELEFLRNERIMFTGAIRKDQALFIDIPKTDGTNVLNVKVPMYWANVAIVNTVESFSSPSTSALRAALQLFRTNIDSTQYSKREANVLAGSGTMLLEDTLGQARVRDDVTTVSATGTPDEAELSVRTAEDALVQKIIEPIMDRNITGLKITNRGLIISQARQLLNDILAQASASGIIVRGSCTKMEFDPRDPRILNWQFEFEPVFTLKRQSGSIQLRYQGRIDGFY